MGYYDKPVHEAARHNAAKLKVLLQQQPDLRDAPAFRNETPLHAAVQADNIDSVNILLQAGADANALNDEGEPPVFAARSKNVMATLKRAGARFDIYSKRGHFGFQHCAAYVRSLEALQFWLAQGVEINHVPDFAWPALVGVCSLGFEDENHDYQREIAIIEFLLENGADIDLQDKTGNAALMNTCWQQAAPLTEVLLKAGANPNRGNFAGTTALHYAVERKNEEIVQLLLSHGADPNQLDKYSKTPIDWAKRKSFCPNIFESLYKPKPEKPMPTADEVIARLQNIPSFRDVALLGCTDEEIDKLEKHFDVILPAAYRYFLKRLGKGAGEFMSSDHLTFEYPYLFEQAQSEDYAEYCKLTKKSFVFSEREGCLFFFFEADGQSDDPPIFQFDDGDSGERQVARSIWEFIEERVIAYEIWELMQS
jgi:ankyrin repeat protein